MDAKKTKNSSYVIINPPDKQLDNSSDSGDESTYSAARDTLNPKNNGNTRDPLDPKNKKKQKKQVQQAVTEHLVRRMNSNRPLEEGVFRDLFHHFLNKRKQKLKHRLDMEKLNKQIELTNAKSGKTNSSSEQSPSGTQKKIKSKKSKIDPKTEKEPVDFHLKNAARWKEHAKRTNDPTRKKQYLDNARFHQAQARAKGYTSSKQPIQEASMNQLNEGWMTLHHTKHPSGHIDSFEHNYVAGGDTDEYYHFHFKPGEESVKDENVKYLGHDRRKASAVYNNRVKSNSIKYRYNKKMEKTNLKESHNEEVQAINEASNITKAKKILQDSSAVDSEDSTAAQHNRKNNTIIARRSYYYRNGKTSEHHAAAVSKVLNDAGIKHTIVDHGLAWKPFKGGAKAAQQSHWWAEVKLDESNEKIEEMKTHIAGTSLNDIFHNAKKQGRQKIKFNGRIINIHDIDNPDEAYERFSKDYFGTGPKKTKTLKEWFFKSKEPKREVFKHEPKPSSGSMSKSMFKSSNSSSRGDSQHVASKMAASSPQHQAKQKMAAGLDKAGAAAKQKDITGKLHDWKAKQEIGSLENKERSTQQSGDVHGDNARKASKIMHFHRQAADVAKKKMDLKQAAHHQQQYSIAKAALAKHQQRANDAVKERDKLHQAHSDVKKKLVYREQVEDLDEMYKKSDLKGIVKQHIRNMEFSQLGDDTKGSAGRAKYHANQIERGYMLLGRARANQEQRRWRPQMQKQLEKIKATGNGRDVDIAVDELKFFDKAQKKWNTRQQTRAAKLSRKSKRILKQKNVQMESYDPMIEQKTVKVITPTGRKYKKVFAEDSRARKYYMNKLHSGYTVTMEENLALIRKAEASKIKFDVLKEVFNRGILSWIDEGVQDHTPQQYAFSRVNSFISNGEARKLDGDLLNE